MFENLYRFVFPETWVRVGDWKSDTVKDLYVQDFGEQKPPSTRTKTKDVSGIDGYVIEGNDSYLAYDLRLSFICKSVKARTKLLKRIKQGKEYEFIFSNDKAYTQVGFVESVEVKKLNTTVAQVIFNLKMKPFKTAIEKTTYDLNYKVEIKNVGDTFGLPTIEIAGLGNFTLSIGGSSLTVILREGQKYFIDCEKMEVLNERGELANSIITRGFFLKIPEGDSTLYINGGGTYKGKITVNWRYSPC